MFFGPAWRAKFCCRCGGGPSPYSRASSRLGGRVASSAWVACVMSLGVRSPWQPLLHSLPPNRSEVGCLLRACNLARLSAVMLQANDVLSDVHDSDQASVALLLPCSSLALSPHTPLFYPCPLITVPTDPLFLERSSRLLRAVPAHQGVCRRNAEPVPQ